MSQSIASLRQVEHRFGTVTALHGIDLDIRANQVTAVLGPNGAGKSTALGLLTGRLTASKGAVQLFGGDPQSIAARQRMGVMLQDTQLPDNQRVDELLRLFASYYPAPMAVEECLTRTELTAVAKRKYSQLSGGQQRLVQFALALVGRPQLLFVDEPTTGLDVTVRQRLWQELKRLKSEGVAIVLTTHYLEEADALADRVVVLRQGRVIADGSPTELKQSLRGHRVRARSALPSKVLAGFADAGDMETLEDGRVQIMSRAPEQLLRQWLAADSTLTQLEVTTETLQDAFLALTEQATRTNQGARNG
jgi:ABC-2 type transport system ATP-binding protein